MTFAQLQEKKITSQWLLSWSAPVDLAERYQIFLNNVSHSLLFEKTVLFYNCTSPWFGPFCQFAFDPSIEMSLDEIVTLNFQSKPKIKKGAKMTCYKHLNCQICLDWREVCDRKMDCFDGSDELNCWQLEINECSDNQYRCHHGQCIPIEFFHDNPLNPDCLDITDEPRSRYYPDLCYRDPAFRCEEHTCRPSADEFPCGDGQCVTKTDFSCHNGRDNSLLDDSCSNAIVCLMNPFDLNDDQWCNEFCSQTNCVQENCPSLFDFSTPNLFGHVHFMFENNETHVEPFQISLPKYVCYDEQLCADFLPPTEQLNNLSCRSVQELGLEETDLFSKFVENINNQFRTCLIVANETHYCNHSTMYQCENSTKCISKHRLLDGIRDCPFDDDETFDQSCSLNDAHHRLVCSVGQKIKCLAPLTIEDQKKNCDDGEDEQAKDEELVKKHIYFQTICDGKRELLPVVIDGRNETDETECDYWPCNNTYSRCDQFWLCKNGADEVNCPPSTCPEFQHSCVFPNETSKVSCLPIEQAGDDVIHCLGGTDERNLCRRYGLMNIFWYEFQCQSDSNCTKKHFLCNKKTDCRFGDDETFCTHYMTGSNSMCIQLQPSSRTEVENFFCDTFDNVKRSTMKYFTLSAMPTNELTDLTPLMPPNQTKTPSIPVSVKHADEWQCNRGLRIHIRMDDDLYKVGCFCPPSYYGDTCQYQNQRVSLTIQVRVASDWRNLFSFIITLIDDNDGNIESHDHIEYLPIRDCDTKFNVYLLYSSRPKNTSKNYSIRIDTFNTMPLSYRASWIFPLQFSFLPVHRLSILLTVPFSDVEPHQKCTKPCIHGQCFNYVNDPSSTFCRCESGWSGAQCTIEYKCNCAPDSLCIADSICVCPLGRFGPRCHLLQSSCHAESCDNGGQCVPQDARHSSTYVNKSTCICPQKYSGNQCEHQQTRIDISFHNELSIPASLLIHFITVQNNSEPIRLSTMKKITWDQNSLTLYTSIRFHLAFAEMFDNYYLITLREQIIVSATIVTQIIPSHRCASIYELFNETLVNRHLLRRIKYYHIPCEERLDLVCFYDSIHFCLCDRFRRVNCFEFDHDMTYNCDGYNLCENGGQCFQDDPKCPTSYACVCPECYYGSRCQFSTEAGSTLSLDAILGYQIRPNTDISRQPLVVKVAIILTTSILILGLISNLLAFLTFRMEKTRTVGCGLYLSVLSITSMILMCVFTIKLGFLLASQMGSIGNYLFVYVQCVSIDFLLQLLLSSSDWFSAWVAIERAVNVFKGIHFDKAKSKQIAKWIIPIVFLFNIGTHIHDPMHRYLIDDEDEERTWCVVKYSSFLQMYDWTVNIFHFSVPFSINCISVFVIIISAARIRSIVQPKQSYMKLLRQQIQHHKHLLISPGILVLIAIPRLIISFLFGCMKSARNPWLYLIGYFISFIPPMLTFIVFVLPSKMYKKEFTQSYKRFLANNKLTL